MYNNRFIIVEDTGELIDIGTLRQNTQKQINFQDKSTVEEVSLSRFEFTNELVTNIIAKRKELNLTQSQLSKLSKVNRSTIAKIESFQRFVVNLNVILRLLDALDLKLSITNK